MYVGHGFRKGIHLHVQPIGNRTIEFETVTSKTYWMMQEGDCQVLSTKRAVYHMYGEVRNASRTVNLGYEV